MDLLKRHYEKVVLAALLLIFIGAMFYLLGIIKQARLVSADQLKIEKREADYAKNCQADQKDAQYNINEQFRMTAIQWAVSTPRDKDATDASGSTFLHKDYFSDLVTVFPIVFCTHCQHLIPRVYFSQVCPNPACRQKLAKAPPFAYVSQIRLGTAADLINSQKATKFSPEDHLDQDNDGFAAIYEKQCLTDPAIQSSHPPYWHRLIVERCGKNVLPIKFVAISSYEKKDKSKNLLFQIDVIQNRVDFRTKKLSEQSRVNDVELNDELKIPFDKGSLVGRKLISHKFTYKLAKADVGDDAKGQKAKLYWESLDEKVGNITMELGKDVYSPNVSVTLLDVGKNVRYDGFMVGDKINLGNRKYQIVTIDADKNVVTLHDVTKKKASDVDENKEAMIVTKTGKIPPEMRVGYQADAAPAAQQSNAAAPAADGKKDVPAAKDKSKK